jgi:ketosteroid isomerase-like protein
VEVTEPVDDAARREANKAVIREIYTNLYEWAENDAEFWRRYFTDDYVMEMPQMGTRTEGLDNLLAGIRSVPQNFTKWRHATFEFHDCLDPDEMIWEADADAVFRHSGEPYVQRYVIFATMRDGKIATYAEYVNMDALAGFPGREA